MEKNPVYCKRTQFSRLTNRHKAHIPRHLFKFRRLAEIGFVWVRFAQNWLWIGFGSLRFALLLQTARALRMPLLPWVQEAAGQRATISHSTRLVCGSPRCSDA